MFYNDEKCCASGAATESLLLVGDFENMMKGRLGCGTAAPEFPGLAVARRQLHGLPCFEAGRRAVSLGFVGLVTRRRFIRDVLLQDNPVASPGGPPMVAGRILVVLSGGNLLRACLGEGRSSRRRSRQGSRDRDRDR